MLAFLNVPLASSRLFPHDGLVANGDELQRVGRAVAARRGQLGMTQQELADAAHVDLKTVYNLESGTRWPIARNRAAISAALNWEGDGMIAIADGGTPVERGTAPPPSEPPLPEFTPELAADMAAWVDEVRLRVALARRHYPDGPLTGKQVFQLDKRGAFFWDAVSALGHHTEESVIVLTAAHITRAIQEEAAEAKRKGNSATGLIRAGNAYATMRA